ncbi:hypothetical protein G6F35_016446 [Rhizopus arrhizus]|nr:hypothetical protein G6F21_014662 [Rhizopus arrhizus]KAG1176782.1 hypothetical protein G6F35_016446 [Rhizopus arrhizus]
MPTGSRPRRGDVRRRARAAGVRAEGRGGPCGRLRAVRAGVAGGGHADSGDPDTGRDLARGGGTVLGSVL